MRGLAVQTVEKHAKNHEKVLNLKKKHEKLINFSKISSILISERHVQETNRDGRATDPAKAKCRGGSHPGGIILGAGHGDVIGWLFGVCL